MNFVVVESHKSDERDMVLFGPFKTKVLADDFCNRRISLLASEYIADEDGAIIDHLEWRIMSVFNPE